ncbi:TolC family protein [Halosquirtibacter laminarini]|uniref:TolC family protein n=1 Tax=Halosquirtibacter laminarini TaxID=3374600 RepID=A0AC61NE07_9BACT|nr:TolC family protein [Prolixibacteraceae bacterium]
MRYFVATIISFLIVNPLVFGKKHFTIGICADNKDHTTVIERVKDEVEKIASNQYDLEFNETRYSHNDMVLASKQYKQEAQKSDLILTFGINNFHILSQINTYPVPTITSGISRIGWYNKGIGRKSNHRNRLVNRWNKFSPIRDIEAFYHLYPFKNIGIVINKKDIVGAEMKQSLDSIAKKKAFSFKLLPIVGTETLEQCDYNQFDAIYFANSRDINPLKFQPIIDEINRSKIFTFSSTQGTNYQQGILGTSQPKINIQQFSKRLAIGIVSEIEEELTNRYPSVYEPEERLYINIPTAKAVALPLSLMMLENVSFTNNVISSMEEPTLTLKASLQQVLIGNLTIEEAKKEVALSEMDVKEAKSDYIPKIGMEITTNYLDPKVAKASFGQKSEISGDASIKASQVIYSYDINKQVNIKKHLSSIEKDKLSIKTIEALYNTSSIYLNALMLQEMITIGYQNMQLTEKHLEVAKQKYKFGQTSKSDSYRLENQRISQIQDLITNTTKLQEAIKTLLVQMNIEESGEIKLATELLNKHFFQKQYEPLNSRILSQRRTLDLQNKLTNYVWTKTPIMGAFKHQREALYEKRKLYTKGKWIPTISAYGVVGDTFLKRGEGSIVQEGFPRIPNQMYQVGIKMSYPILNQNKRHIQSKKTKIEIQKMETQESFQRQQLEQKISSSLFTLQGELQKFRLAESNIEISKKSMELVQQNYAQGQCSIIDVIDAQNNFINTKHQSIIIKLKYYTSLMEIENATGYFFSLHTIEENEKFLSQL